MNTKQTKQIKQQIENKFGSEYFFIEDIQKQIKIKTGKIISKHCIGRIASRKQKRIKIDNSLYYHVSIVEEVITQLKAENRI